MAEQRETVQFFVAGGLSVQRACALVQIHRSTFRYTAHPSDDTAVLSQIQALAAQHPRYGYRRIAVVLNRTAKVNQKRVRRLWRRHRLQVRRVVRKRLRPRRPERLQAAIDGSTQFRPKGGIGGGERIETPYDPEAKWSEKRGDGWVGY